MSNSSISTDISSRLSLSQQTQVNGLTQALGQLQMDTANNIAAWFEQMTQIVAAMATWLLFPELLWTMFCWNWASSISETSLDLDVV